MTRTKALPLHANALLFGSEDAVATIEKSLRKHGIVGSMLRAGRGVGNVGHVVEHEVAASFAGVTDVDLVDVLVGGWRKHTALVAAARRTAAEPGTEEVVDLATHAITSVHRPSVELYVDDVHVGTVAAELRLVLQVACLVAVVRDGELVTARFGRCDAAASLSVEGVPVASRSTTVDLGAELPLRHGMPLLPSGLPAAREPVERHRHAPAPGD